MNPSNDNTSPGHSDDNSNEQGPSDNTPFNSFDERVLSISPPPLRTKRKVKQRRPDNGETATGTATAAKKKALFKPCLVQTLSNSGRFRLALYEAAIANSDGELAFSSEDETFSANSGVSTSGGASGHSQRREAMLTRARKQERDLKQSEGNVGLDEFSIGGAGGGGDDSPDSELETDSARRTSPNRGRTSSFSARTASFKRPSQGQRVSRRNSGVLGSTSSFGSSSGRMECSGERLRFHRDFTQLMRLALPSRREKEAANRCQTSGSSASTTVVHHHQQQQENDITTNIWFEIQCVLEERSSLEMSNHIMQIRNQMPEIIENIRNFRINVGEDDLFMPENSLPFTAMDGPTADYAAHVRQALTQVDALMTTLEDVSEAWPSLHALELDFPDYGQPIINGRLKSLHLWKNITTDLNMRMKRIAKELGLRQHEIDAHWHFVDVDKSFKRNISFGTHADGSTNASITIQSPSDSELSDGGPYISDLSNSTNVPAKVVFTMDSENSTPRSSSPSVSSQSKLPCDRLNLGSKYTPQSADELENVLLLYKNYADKTLKKIGINRLLNHMRDLLDRALQNARRALRRPPNACLSGFAGKSSVDLSASYADVVRDGGTTEVMASSPSLVALTEATLESDDRRSSRTEVAGDESNMQEISNEEELLKHGSCSRDFDAMALPSFLPTYVFLARVPLDALHACLRFRLQQMEHSGKASFLSLGQLIRECKDVLRGAVLVKRYYKRMVSDVLEGEPIAEERLCEQNLEVFDGDVTKMLDVYFDFLQRWITSLQSFQEASRSYKNILENEWAFMKKICHFIRGGEASAAKRFCNLASILLDSIGNFLQKSIDNELGDLFDRTHPMVTDSSEDDDQLPSVSAIEELDIHDHDGHAAEETGEGNPVESVTDEPSGEELGLAENNDTSKDEDGCGHSQSNGRQHKRLHSSDRNQSFDTMRHAVTHSCKDVRKLFREARLRLAKAIGFAKMLRKDLEIAADFDFLRPENVGEQEMRQGVLDALHRTEHVRVRDVPGVDIDTVNFGVFVPRHISGKVDNIIHVLRTICARDATALALDESHPGAPFENPDLGYVLLVEGCAPRNASTNESDDFWIGRDIQLPPQCSAEHTVVMSHRDVCGILLVVAHSNDLERQRQRFLDKMGNLIVLRNEYTACHQSIGEALTDLKQNAITLRERVEDAIHEIEEHLDSAASDTPSDEREMVLKTCRETMHLCYPLGFEYHKELIRLLTGVDMKRAFIPGLLKFAYQWMDFVHKKCETGRGTLPRWSNAGCDFMISLALPCLMTLYTDEQFHTLKRKISDCITHLIGKRTTTPTPSHPSAQQNVFHPPSSPESISATYLDGAHPPSLKVATHTPYRSSSVMDNRRKFSGQISFRSEPIHSSGAIVTDPDLALHHSVSNCTSMCGTSDRRVRTMKKLKTLEKEQSERLTSSRRIGRIVKDDHSYHLPHRMVRQVHFSWQRGVKLGAGQFGTVYTAVNLNTGELMAMKEIRLQHNNHQSVRSLADEIGTFTRLKHPCLVRYFGVEVHREDMLVFMEYCDSGTLQEAARQGLEESLIRRYTREIISGLHCLHENAIVHRDVKSANIFLCKKGPLKLGDFGSSVKLKSITMTQPNELCNMVGTVHYMAPEIITRSGSEGGYGRKSDIWSLGCVVWEMIVGKRPWSEAESDYQIMFRVGMGGRPMLPPNIQASEEAQDFLNVCLTSDPAKRPLASELVDHPFAKVLDEEEDFTPPA